MNNKYKDFIEITCSIVSDRNKQSCISLLQQANIYYSYYWQYQELVKVKRKLSSIYEFANDGKKTEIKIRKNVLDIRYRLFLEFYLQLLKNIYTKISGVNFMELIKDFHEELPSLIKSCGLEDEKIGKKTLYEWIAMSCRNATFISMQKTTKHRAEINLGMNNIREAIKTFYENQSPKQFSEEESFNAVFSEEFVAYVKRITINREPILYMYIAPVKMRLFDSGLIVRTFNNDSWKWCFEKDYRFTLPELKNKICSIQQYDKIFSDFNKISNKLQLITKKINEESIDK